jgi:hypothetical protein
VQRGNAMVLTPAGPLYLVAGRVPENWAPSSPSVHVGGRATGVSGYETLYDVAVAGARVIVLGEGSTGHDGNTVSMLALDLTHLGLLDVSKAIDRVAATARTWFAASDTEVFALRDALEPIAMEPVDLACTADALAVLDDRGVSWFDADGTHAARIELVGGTALAVDRIEPGWLVALGDEIVHVVPGGRPRSLHWAPGTVTKVRRSPAALYARIDRELAVLAGGEVRLVRELTDNVWYPHDFDAGPEGMWVYARSEPVRTGD